MRPDTFQADKRGEVTGLHLDELLTDDEYFTLTDIYDLIEEPLIKAVLPGTGGVVISDDYNDQDVFHPR